MEVEEFVLALEKKGIKITDYQLKQFEMYFLILVEWNEKMNLTAITEKNDVYFKHFYDSVTVAFDFNFNDQSIIDIGAGAGFPSIPLKILFPELNITIVDSLTKRITFLNYLFKELNLSNCKAVSARAEEYIINNREKYDIAMARAVARLNILDELCIPYVKVGGFFLTLKGKIANEELTEARIGIEKLGGEVIDKIDFSLSDESDLRSNIIIKKIKSTPNKYPRIFSKIKKQPL